MSQANIKEGEHFNATFWTKCTKWHYGEVMSIQPS